MAGAVTQQLRNLIISVQKEKLVGENLSEELRFCKAVKAVKGNLSETIFDQKVLFGFQCGKRVIEFVFTTEIKIDKATAGKINY